MNGRENNIFVQSSLAEIYTSVLNMIRLRITIHLDSAIQNWIWIGLNFEKTQPDQTWISKLH